MDASQLAESLNATFAALQQKGYGSRVLVFWYDDQAEFTETFEELSLAEGVEKLKLDHTPFWVKYHLLQEKPDTSFLVYAPHPEPPERENWLLDLQLQAELFSADRAALVFRQLGLRERSLQQLVRTHLSFFQSKQRLSALSKMTLDPESSSFDLRLAMMCVLAGVKVADPQQLLRTLLRGGLSEAENDLFAEITKHLGADAVWQLVAHTLAYQRENPSLRDLFISLSVTHLQQQLGAPLPDALQAKCITPSTKAYVFVDQWLRHRDDAPHWEALSEQIVEDLNIPALARALSPGEYASAETFKVFDAALIQQAVQVLTSPQGDLAEVQDWLAARKVLHWYPAFAAGYEALEAACELLLALQAKPELAAESSALWKAYSARLYRTDQHYRHYVSAADRAGQGLKPLSEHIERAYLQGYLEPLGEAWSNALDGLQTWRVPGAQTQWRFYAHHVQPILERSEREKVFVIISDALRFEVAQELQQRLITDLRGEATLTPLQGVLPSITKLGMAALLPHTSLEVDDKGAVTVGGQPVQSREQRQAVLASTAHGGVALGLDGLLAMDRQQGRSAVQPHRVIYLYHDLIDALGDKPASERGVFRACEDAIERIHQAIKRIVNQLNGTNVLIVSDHGFLYQRQSVETHQKVKQPKGTVLDSGRRYALGRGLSVTEGSQVFTLPFVKPEDLLALTPRGSLRYALQGAGAQYVHGGSSLQEVCVPLLTYKHVRATKGDEGPSRKVGVRVNASSRRITNNTFTVRLVQDEPVAERVRPRSISVQFVDESGQAITNSYPLLLDSSAPQATDREYIARLTIGSSELDQAQPCDLVITDRDDDLEIVRETWRVDLAFTDDFGEFG